MLTNLIREVKDMSATATTGVGITRIGQVSINAKDVKRAAAFYENRLGLKLLFKAPPGLAFFACGGVRLMLDRAEKPEFAHPSSVLYFAVPDIQAAYRRRSALRGRAAPDRENAGTRLVDDVFPRHRR